MNKTRLLFEELLKTNGKIQFVRTEGLLRALKLDVASGQMSQCLENTKSQVHPDYVPSRSVCSAIMGSDSSASIVGPLTTVLGQYCIQMFFQNEKVNLPAKFSGCSKRDAHSEHTMLLSA